MTRYIFSISAICCTFFIPAALMGQNVGIGTSTPAAKLDIIGSLKITDGTQGANKILTSDTAGMAKWANPPAPACFLFAFDNSISNNSFLGLGSSSSIFVRNTIVVPFNCELSSIAFSTRGTALNTYTATIYKQTLNGIAQATTLSTTVNVGGIFSITNGSVPLLQGDLISVQVSSSGSGLSSGAAVSVTYK